MKKTGGRNKEEMEETKEEKEQRTKMEMLQTQLKASKINKTQEMMMMSHEDVKRQEAYNMSPRAGRGGSAIMGKSSSGRFNCLCAPTTHPGSFRCRYHRRSSGGIRMPRGVSVPTNLSMMGSSKPDE